MPKTPSYPSTPPAGNARSRTQFACLLGVLLAAGLPVRASASAVSVEVVPTALAGQDLPKLVVVLNQPVASWSVVLTASDGSRVEQTFNRPRPGRREIALSHKPGTVTWQGRLSVSFGDEEQGMPLNFDTTLQSAPKLSLPEKAVDLDKRTLSVAVDRDGGSLEVRVLSDEGVELAHFTRAFDEAKADEPRQVSWPQPPDARVLRIDVRAVDQHGLYSDLELYPWRIDVPHEDVLFETGKAEVTAQETPKLERSLVSLNEALSKYGRFAKVRVFVAGHTDTVGPAASNQALSEARALAIARWFRKRGVKVPISYAGLGESTPLVPTADETDEPRNRRAEYIVAVEPPAGVTWLSVK